MRICVAQTRPIRGDIQRNILSHERLLRLAVSHRADTVIFPELSLTGYEPELAKALAVEPQDRRLDVLQRICDNSGVTVGVGVPTRSSKGTFISMVILGPEQSRHAYSKRYLHADEEKFFAVGEGMPRLAYGDGSVLALAICFELSVVEHAEEASAAGATIYLASVAKPSSPRAGGLDKACSRLSEIAKSYSMAVLMANSVGRSGRMQCGGRSSVWDNAGTLLGEMNDIDEGVLVLDTKTHELFQETI